MSEQIKITLAQLDERLMKVERANKDMEKILEIQGKIIDKLVEDKMQDVEQSGKIKKSKSVRITKIIVGMLFLTGSTTLAIWFGYAAGLRGCGNQVMEYPGYVYAIVFAYILCSGMIPAAWMFGFGRKGKK